MHNEHGVCAHTYTCTVHIVPSSEAHMKHILYCIYFSLDHRFLLDCVFVLHIYWYYDLLGRFCAIFIYLNTVCFMQIEVTMAGALFHLLLLCVILIWTLLSNTDC